MYTIRIVPIARGTPVDELTYFSAVEYSVGSLLYVPIRSKDVLGVVVGVDPVRSAKTALKTSDFALRKLKRQKPVGALLPEFMSAAEQTARYHASSMGALLYRYVTKQLVAALPRAVSAHATRPRLRGFIVPRLYQGLGEHRVEFYRTAVREAFAAKGSVLLIAPTAADAVRVFDSLATGIDQYAFLITSTQTPRVQQDRIKRALQSEHPVLVVTTAGSMAIPRHDLTTIIVEREGSSLYRERTRPFVDTRILAHHFAAALGGQLYLADLPLRIESIYRREQGEYEEVVSGHHRFQFAAPARIISLAGERREPKKRFRAVNRELLARIRDITDQGGRVILYVARRGLSPVTLCGDCGSAVVCDECGASVVLHKGTDENYFLCHSCGTLRRAAERCRTCNSWRLEAFGIGAELVAEEIAAVFPELPLHTLSSDTAKTHTVVERMVQTFYATPRSILIATELALPYLNKAVPLVGVVSLDSLLSMAHWNIYEKLAATLTRLREIAGSELLLQTRHPDTEILDTVLSGNFSGYYKSELRARKHMGYPPYTVIIKVSVSGTEEDVVAKIDAAVRALEPYELIPFSRMLRTQKGKYSLHGFLRIAREEWPHEDLHARLRSLSPTYTVMVDPDSIL